MPYYRATFGANAHVYFMLSLEAADEPAAISQAVALWRDRHPTQRLTLVDESAHRWRIDDLVRLDVRHQPDWDHGIVCEDVPLDDEARLVPIEEQGAALLRMVGALLGHLHQPSRPWWSAVDPATSRQIVDVLAWIDPSHPVATAAAVIPAINRCLGRLEALPGQTARAPVSA